MGLLSRIFKPKPSTLKHVEGDYHSGPWLLPYTGGYLPADVGDAWNWWQMGHDPVGGVSTSAMVEACVSAYSQTVAMCPGDHWRADGKGGRERVTNSALYRIFRSPNDYQTISDFLLNATRNLYDEGNAYGLCLRNDRYEIESIHLMRSRTSGAQLAVDGSIFYHLAGNEVVEKRFDYERLIVPARDVLHVKLHTPVHPLKGVSPIVAVMVDIAAGGAMTRQQAQFWANQARPSIAIGTDQILNKEQIDFLRARWDEQTKGANAGGTPILSAGLKPLPLGNNAKDSELAEIMKLTEQHIALAFRVPMQILGIGGTPFASTELLMQSWRGGGLGFVLNHIETAFDKTFGLKGQPDEYTEFNTAALMRSAFKERIEALALGTGSGLITPNEGRAELELPSVKHGDDPRMQQQNVPLSFGAELQPPKPAPAAPPADEAEDIDDDAEPDPRAIADSILKAAKQYYVN